MEYIVGLVILAVVIIALLQSVKVIRQQKVAIVERLGKFRRTLEPGAHLVVPILDQVRYTLDMREAVVPFPPQGVITEDNLMVNIDSVIYFQVIDPVRAAYEAQNYIQAIEQLTMTTLRNIIGGLDLERTLTSREDINQKLRAVLDEATGKWGIKVNRVELRSVEPPATIRDAMEKGARAERDKRAAILLAEGQRQSQILSASGDREASILRAQGERESAVLRAQADRQAKMLRSEGEAQAITTVFNAIHAGKPSQSLLAYQYMQMLPAIARGDSNKVWIVPSELNDALKGLGSTVGRLGAAMQQDENFDPSEFTAPAPVDVLAEIRQQKEADEAESQRTVQQAIAEAQQLEKGVAARLSAKPARNQQIEASIPTPDVPEEKAAPSQRQQAPQQWGPPAGDATPDQQPRQAEQQWAPPAQQQPNRNAQPQHPGPDFTGGQQG